MNEEQLMFSAEQTNEWVVCLPTKSELSIRQFFHDRKKTFSTKQVKLVVYNHRCSETYFASMFSSQLINKRTYQVDELSYQTALKSVRHGSLDIWRWYSAVILDDSLGLQTEWAAKATVNRLEHMQ